MKLYVLLISIFFIFYFSACKMNVDDLEISLVNNLDAERKADMISISIEELKRHKNNSHPGNFIVMDNGTELPYQIEIDDSGKEMLIFPVDMPAKSEKVIKIEYGSGVEKNNYRAQTYAELAMKTSEAPVNGIYPGGNFEKVFKIKVPGIHKDHDALFKYEGPGWESELVGYRLYLDKRNAIDIFGKVEKGLFLETTGIHDTVAADDSYHKMQTWGMDIFKVGGSAGLGSFGMFVNDKIEKVSETDSVFYELVCNGPVKSGIRLNYNGWNVAGRKYDLQSDLTINAGSRLTRNDLKINTDVQNLSTGLVKNADSQYFEKINTNGWSYIALYGNQSLNNDSLGIALFFNKNDFIKTAEDEENHILVLKPSNGKLTYYFCAAWEKEPEGIKNKKEFIEYLESVINELNNPVKVNYN
ncbi:MAG: DUF4861 domain-containing protein [Ignavibacteria bacterium]|nr:DUF4861 domain-containing protein [Ignavibacteria bacterium]